MDVFLNGWGKAKSCYLKPEHSHVFIKGVTTFDS